MVHGACPFVLCATSHAVRRSRSNDMRNDVILSEHPRSIHYRERSESSTCVLLYIQPSSHIAYLGEL